MYTVHIQNVHRTFEEIVLRTEPKTFRGWWPWKYGLKGGGDDDHDGIGNIDTAVADLQKLVFGSETWRKRVFR